MAPDGSRHQDPTDDEELLELLHESACRVPLPKMGDAICFDSRTLHCATANVSTQRRVLLYVSLAARSWHGRAWRGVGFDRPGTLLNELRGKYYLSADGLRLVQIRQEVGISAKISAWAPLRIVLAAARLCLCLCQCMRAYWALVGACLSTTVTATRFGCMPLHQHHRNRHPIAIAGSICGSPEDTRSHLGPDSTDALRVHDM
jgi:hypothetical protein